MIYGQNSFDDPISNTGCFLKYLTKRGQKGVISFQAVEKLFLKNSLKPFKKVIDYCNF